MLFLVILLNKVVRGLSKSGNNNPRGKILKCKRSLDTIGYREQITKSQQCITLKAGLV